MMATIPLSLSEPLYPGASYSGFDRDGSRGFLFSFLFVLAFAAPAEKRDGQLRGEGQAHVLIAPVRVEVVTAASGEEAFPQLAASQFDVLISDIGMPVQDGYTFLRRVRGLGPDNGGSIPALALTAYARAEDRVRAILAGFQMHIAKPVEPVELITMVASLSGRTNRATPSRSM